MNLISYSKYKKRVVSTLFLFGIILLLGCDFTSPEEWETPGWYTNLTLPLINKEYSFEELLSDTMFYSDTLNVAMPSDTVSNVIHLTYNIIMDPLQIPDSIFDIDMSSVQATIPDFGDLGDPILIPHIPNDTHIVLIPTDFTLDPLLTCFPKLFIEDISIQQFDTTILTENLEVENDFIKIKTIIVDTVTSNVKVENNLPFPVSVEFLISNGTEPLFNTETALYKIMPYKSEDTTIINIDTSIDLTKDLIFNVTTDIYEETTDNCGIQGGVPVGLGWNIEAGVIPALSITFAYEFGSIDTVIVSNNAFNQTETIKNFVPGTDVMEIFRAKMASSTEDDTNKVFLVIENDFFLPLDIALTFHNFFDSVGINQWDSLKKIIELVAFEEKLVEIDYSGMVLSAGIPDPLVSAIIPGANIKSIDLDLSVNIDPGEGTLTVTHEDDTTSYITQTGPKLDSIFIGNMSLEYIEAITHELTFEAPSAPIEGLPTGFTDVEFVDLKFGMGLFNEIGIPMSLNLDVVGKRELQTNSVIIDSLEIGVPYGTSHNCDFALIGDTARTDILLTKDSLYTLYYCNNDTSLMINDVLDDQSNLIDLVNLVPEQFIVNGNVIMDGEGRVAKGTNIWGTFILETPFSFRFKKQMTIIPADPWPLAPIDDPETSEKINSSLIEGEFFVDITNRSSLGGNLSLLISDSTIFPLFLDSLGIWDTQIILDTLEKTFEIDIDSISYIAIDPTDNKSKALEVRFLKQDEDDEYIQQFFVGRMFEIVFPATDSIDYHWGYAIPAFPGLYTSSVKLDTTILSWLITDEPRNSTAMITFDGSPFQLTDSTYTPVTSQTTNAIEVQAYLTLKLDTGGLIE